MTNKQHKPDYSVDALKSDAARQRWELFHRAIAHAKESNHAALLEADAHGGDTESAGPLLSIVR